MFVEVLEILNVFIAKSILIISIVQEANVEAKKYWYQAVSPNKADGVVVCWWFLLLLRVWGL